MATLKKSNKNVLLIVGLLIVLVVGFFIGHITTSGKSASSSTTTITQVAASPSITIVANGAVPMNNTVIEILYANKTVTIPAMQHNYVGYNLVIGCYWMAGYYNLSFNAPYPGYIVFNETNSGIPTNFTNTYFVAYLSSEKPRYTPPQPYNDTSFCPGEIVQSNIAPWTQISPYDNQTMIVPIRNGTNYVIFENMNGYDKKGINPFPINVTFSMKYYGFKSTSYVTVPRWNFNISSNTPWWRFGNTTKPGAH
jgi:hypothetical protein